MLPDYLNVYDVSKRDTVKILNAVLVHWWAPVKLGGVFHVAIAINGARIALNLNRFIMLWVYGEY